MCPQFVCSSYAFVRYSVHKMSCGHSHGLLCCSQGYVAHATVWECVRALNQCFVVHECNGIYISKKRFKYLIKSKADSFGIPRTFNLKWASWQLNVHRAHTRTHFAGQKVSTTYTVFKSEFHFIDVRFIYREREGKIWCSHQTECVCVRVCSRDCATSKCYYKSSFFCPCTDKMRGFAFFVSWRISSRVQLLRKVKCWFNFQDWNHRKQSRETK